MNDMTKKSNLIRMMVVFFTIVVLVASCSSIVLAADHVVLNPTENQYLELRAVSVEEVEGQNLQVMMELRGHNIEFKGFDVRLSYDSEKIKLSNKDTNEILSTITGNQDEFFTFEDEFIGKLEATAFAYDGPGEGLRFNVAFDEPSVTTHIKNKEGIGYVVDTTSGDVLLGTMSFQMLAEEFDASWFQLEGSETTSPRTGIKIDETMLRHYEATSTFRFVDETASKDADLINIKLTSGVVDEIEPENSTYKEHAFDKTFDKDTLNYTVTLEEFLDTMDLTITKSDETSTAKVYVPKRENGELVYKYDFELSQVVIDTNEVELQTDTPLNIEINKINEEDTVLKIVVTAEDGKTTKEYTITIKRPHGTIKGKIQLGKNVRESTEASYGITTKYIADIKLYEDSQVNWSDIIPGDITLEEIEENEEVKTQTQSDDEGEYEVYVLPGKYDLLIERLGYLADVTTGISIADGEVIDLNSNGEPTILTEGDVDRSGMVTLNDMVLIVNLNGSNKGDGTYQESGDFGQKDFVSLADLVFVQNNMLGEMSLKSY